MTQTHTQSHITDVLQKIQSKEISTHSKLFFRLRWLAFMILVLAICIVSIMLCSFILFTIRMTGQPYLFGFGSQGITLAFIIFPWILFLIDGLLIILLGTLTRHTSFGYKIPGVYILIVSIVIIGLSGYIVESKTAFHIRMLQRADAQRLPIFSSAYQGVRRAPPTGYEIYRGVVVEEGENYIRVNIAVRDQFGTSTNVTVAFATSTPSRNRIGVGQTIFLSGKIIDGQVINARLKPIPQLPIHR
jgi:uncharacterized membrane protein